MSHMVLPVPKERLAAMGAVVLLHITVIYAVLLALGTVPVPIPANYFVSYIEPEASKPSKLPELPVARIPERPFDFPVPPVPPTTDDGTWHPSGDLVAPRLDPRSGVVRPPYPPASIHLGEEGRVTLALLIGADGRVTDGKVDRSSGYPRLDQAALEAARRTMRFLPGTEDGRPRAMWHRITIAFRLDDVRGK
jgi:periplasmic protein TonB